MIELIGIAKRRSSRSQMKELDSAKISFEKGVEDDFRGKPGKRQITILSHESWKQACQEIGTELEWTIRRSNLLIKGGKFSSSDISKIVCIGDVSLEIMEETEPCIRMDEQHEGLTTALKPNYRGGVCCRVLKSGLIKIGDKVEIN